MHVRPDAGAVNNTSAATERGRRGESGSAMSWKCGRRSAAIVFGVVAFAASGGSALAASGQQLCTGAPGTAVTIPVSANTCASGQTLVTLATDKQLTSLQSQVAALQTTLSKVSYKAKGLNGVPTLTISGANLQVDSGSGSTAGPVNSMGNLFIGYDEGSSTQDGSNNLVLGDDQTFTSYGGLIAGQNNSDIAPFAGLFGFQNVVSGEYGDTGGGKYDDAAGVASSVSGGEFNTAAGPLASVTGGCSNLAGAGTPDPDPDCSSTGLESISGGFGSQAIGQGASVSGGEYNLASDQMSSISGGCMNLTGSAAELSGTCANSGLESISGGSNRATGYESWIGGGVGDDASSPDSSVSGGLDNAAKGDYAAVTGGEFNTASGPYASVSGGGGNTASGDEGSVAGGANNTASGGDASVLGGSHNTAAGSCQAIPAAPPGSCS
jgi:hypothetical protein